MWEIGTCDVCSAELLVLNGQGLPLHTHIHTRSVDLNELDIFEKFSSSVINLSQLICVISVAGACETFWESKQPVKLSTPVQIIGSPLWGNKHVLIDQKDTTKTVCKTEEVPEPRITCVLCGSSHKSVFIILDQVCVCTLTLLKMQLWRNATSQSKSHRSVSLQQPFTDRNRKWMCEVENTQQKVWDQVKDIHMQLL